MSKLNFIHNLDEKQFHIIVIDQNVFKTQFFEGLQAEDKTDCYFLGRTLVMKFFLVNSWQPILFISSHQPRNDKKCFFRKKID